MKNSARHLSNSPRQTELLGAKFAKQLRRHDVVALTGEIGSGKTTFVRGMAQGLKIPVEQVASPSFVLVREYRVGRLPLYHADLFRLEGMPAAATVGLEEFFEADGITVIEWGTQIPGVLPEEFLEVRFEVVNPKKRKLKLIPHGKSYAKRKWI